MTVTGLEKVNVIYVNNKILELEQLLSKSTCWIETIFLRGKQAESWLLIGVLKASLCIKLRWSMVQERERLCGGGQRLWYMLAEQHHSVGVDQLMIESSGNT